MSIRSNETGLQRVPKSTLATGHLSPKNKRMAPQAAHISPAPTRFLFIGGGRGGFFARDGGGGAGPFFAIPTVLVVVKLGFRV
jgi:hypothetical protein